jgi:uroporphyrinogen decarboxylase
MRSLRVAPWTLATYTIAGCGTVDQFPARQFAYQYPDAFAKLIDVLIEASASYLHRQFAAGAAGR